MKAFLGEGIRIIQTLSGYRLYARTQSTPYLANVDWPVINDNTDRENELLANE